MKCQKLKGLAYIYEHLTCLFINIYKVKGLDYYKYELKDQLNKTNKLEHKILILHTFRWCFQNRRKKVSLAARTHPEQWKKNRISNDIHNESK